MYDRILVPLDGSAFAEEVLPYAVGLARSTGAAATLLRAVQDEGELVGAEEYISRLARRLGAESEVLRTHSDPASVILSELDQRPGTLVAMTTHGRTGLLESILGSVAHRIVHGATRPVLLYRPRGGTRATDIDKEAPIATVVAAIDGSPFSERMLPHAAETAKAATASLILVQVLPSTSTRPRLTPPGDVLESGYVRGWAGRIRTEYGIEAEWDVLHGEPAEAIYRYVNGRRDVMLAMSSHARPRLRETVFGSVTHECVRRSGVPILVWGTRA